MTADARAALAIEPSRGPGPVAELATGGSGLVLRASSDPGAGQASGLRDATRPVARARRAKNGRVIAVASGKGGVGKSTIAASLGVALAQRGRRTLLVDADLGLAGLDLVLGVRPAQTVLDVVHGGARAEDVLVRGPHGVHLLPAAPGRYDLANLGALERARVRDTIEGLAASHDVVVLDTGAGIGALSVELAATASEVLVVVTPDPTAIRDAYASIKTLAGRGSSAMALVVNQVDGPRQGLQVAARLGDLAARFLGLELRAIAHIPRDPSVGAALAAAVPFVLRTPEAAASRALLALTDAIDKRERC